MAIATDEPGTHPLWPCQWLVIWMGSDSCRGHSGQPELPTHEGAHADQSAQRYPSIILVCRIARVANLNRILAQVFQQITLQFKLGIEWQA
jgi:hypothetical protein